MNEITVNEENQTVSARELHERLKIGTRFNDWFLRVCEYGFADVIDFYSKMSKIDGAGRAQTMNCLLIWQNISA